MRHALLALSTVVGCAVTDGPTDHTDVDTDTDAAPPCGGAPTLVFAPELADPTGQMSDGAEVRYGTPPQGGAPYAPLQTVVRGPTSGDDPPVAWATATDVDSGEVIGTDHVEPDPGTPVRSWVCSNVGAFEGWWYAGEVHLRFWDLPLAELEGRNVRFDVRITLPGGVVAEASATGVLHDPTLDTDAP